VGDEGAGEEEEKGEEDEEEEEDEDDDDDDEDEEEEEEEEEEVGEPVPLASSLLSPNGLLITFPDKEESLDEPIVLQHSDGRPCR